MMIGSIVERWDKHQIVLYLVAIAAGGAVGLTLPQIAPTLEHSIEPVLMLLLFATFLGVPLIEVGRAFRDIRFLSTVMIANFVVVPLISWGLSRFVADDRGLLLGVLFVLLTPCIDYVIVFTGLAGGAKDRLLAAAPLLMLVQILLLPLFLILFAGGDVLDVIDIGPFVEAFLLLIVLPLAAAAAEVRRRGGGGPSARPTPSCREDRRGGDGRCHGSADDGHARGRRRVTDRGGWLSGRGSRTRHSDLHRLRRHRCGHRQTRWPCRPPRSPRD